MNILCVHKCMHTCIADTIFHTGNLDAIPGIAGRKKRADDEFTESMFIYTTILRVTHV